MSVAAGFWALVIGYALIFTGVEYFVTGKSSLATNLGLGSAALTATTPTTAVTSSTRYSSDLAAVAASLGSTSQTPSGTSLQ